MRRCDSPTLTRNDDGGPMTWINREFRLVVDRRSAAKPVAVPLRHLVAVQVERLSTLFAPASRPQV